MSIPTTPQFEQTDKVKFLVDDVPYSIDRDILTKYPESYFCQLLSKSSETGPNHQVSIKGRDAESAELFIYIYEYLRYGCLPRDFDGECLLLKEALPVLRKEAVFYSIQDLIDEIDDEMNGGVKRLKKQAKQRKIKELKPVEHFALGGHATLKEDTVFLSVYKQLISAVDGSMGGIYVDCGPLNRLDLDSIIENCSELTYVDQTFSYKRTNDNEKKALEIGATKLKIDERDRDSPEVIDNILFIVCRDLFHASEKGEYSLILQDSGDCPITYEENDVGTLLVCLPNEHKGGELTVTFTATGVEYSYPFETKSNDCSVLQFVAFDKGCTYEFKKVTEGYQIILTYTIRRVPEQEQPENLLTGKDGQTTVITGRSGPRRPVSPPVDPPTPEPTEPVEESGSVIEVNPAPVVPEAKGGCCTVM